METSQSHPQRCSDGGEHIVAACIGSATSGGYVAMNRKEQLCLSRVAGRSVGGRQPDSACRGRRCDHGPRRERTGMQKIGRSEQSVLPVVFIGWLAVILVDAGGSLVSIGTGLPYGYFGILSLAIYAAVGVITRSRGGSNRSSALAGFGVAVFDGTIGWWISWLIGPGRMPVGESSLGLLTLIITVALVVVVDTVISLGAGAAWYAIRRRRELR